MFDLELAITQWRAQMLAAGIQTPTPLEELESHLRDEIATSMDSGSSAVDAFHSAAQKIGRPQMVQTEFRKVEPAGPRPDWKFFALLFGGFTFLFPFLTGSAVYVFKHGSLAELTPGQQMSSLAASITFSLLAYALRCAHEKFAVLQTRQIRDALLASVMLLLVILAYVVIPRAGLEAGPRSAASLWALAPFGIVLGWCWGFAAAAHKKPTLVT